MSTLTKKIFKNASYLIVARTAFRLLTAIVMIYAARYLGVERYGMFETALAWSNAFLALNDVGMSTLIVREAARDEKKMAVYFGNTLIVEIILSLVLYAAIVGIGIGLDYNPTTISLLAILGAAGLIFEFRKVMRGIFRVMLKLKAVAFLEVLNGALYFFITLGIIEFVSDRNFGLLGIAHTRLWVNVLIVLALFFYTLKFVRPAFAPKQIWPMIKQSYVFTLYNMFFMLYFQIDQILLSILADETAVGIYGAPAKIITFLLFVPLMVFQVIMPTMYRLSEKNIEKYKRVNRTVWRYLVAFGIPAGVGLSLLAEETILLAFGNEYYASIPLLVVFGIFYSIRLLGLSQGNSMTTTDRQGLRAAIQIVSVGINIVLDIFLITRYGAVGAAIATLITESVIATSYLVSSARFLKESLVSNFAKIAPVFFATAGMAVLIRVLESLHVLLIIPIAIVVYLFLLWAFRFFKPRDKEILLQIAGKK